MSLITRGLTEQGLITRGMAAVTVIIQQLTVGGQKLVNYVFSSVHINGSLLHRIMGNVAITGTLLYYVKNSISLLGSRLSTFKTSIVVKGRNLTLVNRIIEFLDLNEELEDE